MGKQCRHNTNLNFSLRYIANLMQTLSYCKSVNNCSPNLLLFKVARKLFWPFFACPAFWPCPAQLLIHIAQCPSCPALFFSRRPALLLLCPLLICPPALLANSPISGRSDRKVLRLILYIIYSLGRIGRTFYSLTFNLPIWYLHDKCVRPIARRF